MTWLDPGCSLKQFIIDPKAELTILCLQKILQKSTPTFPLPVGPQLAEGTIQFQGFLSSVCFRLNSMNNTSFLPHPTPEGVFHRHIVEIHFSRSLFVTERLCYQCYPLILHNDLLAVGFFIRRSWYSIIVERLTTKDLMSFSGVST